MADKNPAKKIKGGAMAAMNMQFGRPVLASPPDPFKVKIGEGAPPEPV